MNQSFLSSTGVIPRSTGVMVSLVAPCQPGLVLGASGGEGRQGAVLKTYSPHSKNAQGEEKEKLTAQALDLSLKYHFVTPLTSMVVTKPEDDENQTDIADKPGEGGHRERRAESGDSP